MYKYVSSVHVSTVSYNILTIHYRHTCSVTYAHYIGWPIDCLDYIHVYKPDIYGFGVFQFYKTHYRYIYSNNLSGLRSEIPPQFWVTDENITTSYNDMTAMTNEMIHFWKSTGPQKGQTPAENKASYAYTWGIKETEKI